MHHYEIRFRLPSSRTVWVATVAFAERYRVTTATTSKLRVSDGLTQNDLWARCLGRQIPANAICAAPVKYLGTQEG